MNKHSHCSVQMIYRAALLGAITTISMVRPLCLFAAPVSMVLTQEDERRKQQDEDERRKREQDEDERRKREQDDNARREAELRAKEDDDARSR